MMHDSAPTSQIFLFAFKALVLGKSEARTSCLCVLVAYYKKFMATLMTTEKFKQKYTQCSYCLHNHSESVTQNYTKWSGPDRRVKGPQVGIL